jgi:hypothetical protein
MPIHPDALSSLASDYTKHMTSIRGRRVQRLLKREFAGADDVLVTQTSSGAIAVIGLSATGAALCVTDGTGKHASVFKWLHDGTQALETRFDLHKDSLLPLSTADVPFTELGIQVRLPGTTESMAPEAACAMLARKVNLLVRDPA